jgi:hypothetical protein
MKNPVRIEGDVAYIALGQREGTGLYEAVVDTASLPLLAPYRWGIQHGKWGVYAKTTVGRRGEQRGILMHRLINNTPEQLQCDHIDGNRLNNRSANLREATPMLNGANRHGPNRNTRSGERGVSWESFTGKWRVTGTRDGKTVRLGRFTSLDEAKRVAQEYNCG